MLEPLCLAVLEARLRDSKTTADQPLLFSETDVVD